MSASVLVVEDDRDLRELLRRYLERAGFTVHTTASGAEAIRILSTEGTQLVVLDLGLPDVDGLEVLTAAHGGRPEIPVVVVTARDAIEDRIRGLQLGADDYVTKPFSPTELVLRVKAVLHRTNGGATGESERSFGGNRLRIDEARHEITVDGRLVDLTPTEWGLLVTMAETPGRVFSRYELVNRVRGYEFSGYERSIDSHVKNLRRKLDDANGRIVQTVLGVGYRLGLSRDH